MMHLAYARIADAIKTLGVPAFIGTPGSNVDVPFVRVWGPLPTRQPATLSGSNTTASEVVKIMVVHTSSANVFALSARVHALLDGFAPKVDGWRVFPLKVVGSSDVTTEQGVFDEKSNDYTSFLTLLVRLRATKEILV